MSTHYIPKGHHAIEPYFVVKNVHNLIDFLTSSFGAEVLEKFEIPGRGIAARASKIPKAISGGSPLTSKT